MAESKGSSLFSGKRPLVICIVVVLVVAAGIAAIGLVNRGEGQQNKSIVSLLKEGGYAGSVDDWLQSLSDEQKAMIDIAYDAAGDEDRAKTEAQWVSEKVKGRLAGDSSIVVVLPDGAEFEARINDSEPAPKKDSTDKSASPSNAEEASSGADNTSSASELTAISVDSVKAKRGENGIEVPVRIAHNPGIVGLTLSINYDSKSLKLTGLDNGPAFSPELTLTHAQDLGSGCVVSWDGLEVAGSGVRDGAILNLKFDVLNEASGYCSVSVGAVGTAYDNALGEVSYTTEGGFVIVE